LLASPRTTSARPRRRRRRDLCRYLSGHQCHDSQPIFRHRVLRLAPGAGCGLGSEPNISTASSQLRMGGVGQLLRPLGT